MIQWHTVIALERSRFAEESRVAFAGLGWRPDPGVGTACGALRLGGASVTGTIGQTKFSNGLAEQV